MERELNRLYHAENEYVELEHPIFCGYEFTLVPSNPECNEALRRAIKKASPSIKFSDKPFIFSNWKHRSYSKKKDKKNPLFDENGNFLPKEITPVLIHENDYKRLPEEVQKYFMYEKSEYTFFYGRRHETSFYKLHCSRNDYRVECSKMFITRVLIPDGERESRRQEISFKLYYSGDKTLQHHWGYTMNDWDWLSEKMIAREKADEFLMAQELKDFQENH